MTSTNSHTSDFWAPIAHGRPLPGHPRLTARQRARQERALRSIGRGTADRQPLFAHPHAYAGQAAAVLLGVVAGCAGLAQLVFG